MGVKEGEGRGGGEGEGCSVHGRGGGWAPRELQQTQAAFATGASRGGVVAANQGKGTCEQAFTMPYGPQQG
jgi:hypothetical protein